MAFDWKAIHPLNGSQASAFEELCAQLARAETPDGAKFHRKGVPDAGVECFCVLPDSGEWGWQAKYFSSPPANTQWQQLDDSVKTALDKHPRLVRYYACVPRDRSDGRKPKQTSEMDQWNNHFTKWEGWASDRGMDVEFVYWGSSELIDLLSRQSEGGRLFFWFGEVELNQSWFGDRLGEAVKAAGPRYTPEANVDLEIAQHLAAFARTEEALDRIKALARQMRKEFQAIAPAPSKDDPLQRLDLLELPQIGNAILEKFAALDLSPVDEIPLRAIASEIDQAQSIAVKVIQDLRQLERDYDTQKNPGAQALPHRSNPYRDWLHRIYRLQSGLSEAGERLSEADNLVNRRLLTIKGDAGTGKTHLLCDFACERMKAGAPVVLLLGQWFSESGEPWTQLLQQLGLQGKSPEQFIGALEAAAQAANSRVLVMIDALNEGRGREIWPSHLASFLARLERSPWIGVALSVRSSYEEAVLPVEVKDRSVVLTHEGFAGREYDAVQTYFSFYGLEFPSTPILQPDFGNPLFLKTLCEGLHHEGQRRVPRGFYGITAAFDLYLNAINKKLATQLDYNPNDYLVREGLERVAKDLIGADRRSIPRTRAQEIVDELLPNRTFSNSLYRGLVTEGILIEDKSWWTDNPSEDVALIAYDRFADHVIADYLGA